MLPPQISALRKLLPTITARCLRNSAENLRKAKNTYPFGLLIMDKMFISLNEWSATFIIHHCQKIFFLAKKKIDYFFSRRRDRDD